MFVTRLEVPGTLVFEGELAITTVADAKRSLEQLERHDRLELDTTRLESIDFAGVQLLEWFSRRLRGAGVQVSRRDGRCVTRALELLGLVEPP